MGKDKKYLANDTMFMFALLYFLFLIAISITLCTISRYISALVFLLISIPFLAIVFRYGSVVKVEKVFLSRS